jgi:hypothetical protein
MKRIQVFLKESTIGKIDKKRGAVPTSNYVRMIIEEKIK